MEEYNKNNSGQRISVRPSGFNPHGEAKSAIKPAEKAAVPAQTASAPHQSAPQATAQNNNRTGEGAHKSRNRRRRGRGGKDHRPREERPAQTQGAQSVAEPVVKTPQKQEAQKTGGNHRNRRGKRGGKNHETAPEQNAPALSLSLQKELDDEFGASKLQASAKFSSKMREEKAQLLDSEEFAVDIATASYLTEDIPCGFPIPDGKAVEVIGIRFREAGRVYFFAPGDLKFSIGDRAIVDTARGPEIGNVVMLKRKIAEKDVVQPLRSVLRLATPEDMAHDEQNRAKEAEALRVCERKIAIHKLDMRLVDAQYTFDNSKLLFYFTSEGRVDFRELVHDLAGHFHTRIELRQIGIRDESRLIGGLGMCGRPFCCATYLQDFGQVSVKMAKEQGLSINASKISGCCGRLMCCLRYEHETYVAETKLTPKKDTAVLTPDGEGVVVDASPLAGTVRVRLDATPEEAPKTYHRDTLTVLGKAAKRDQKAETKKQEEAQE